MKDYSKLTLEERKAMNEKMRQLTKEALKREVQKVGQVGKKVGKFLYKSSLPAVAGTLLNRFGKKLPTKEYEMRKGFKFQKTK